MPLTDKRREEEYYKTQRTEKLRLWHMGRKMRDQGMPWPQELSFDVLTHTWMDIPCGEHLDTDTVMTYLVWAGCDFHMLVAQRIKHIYELPVTMTILKWGG